MEAISRSKSGHRHVTSRDSRSYNAPSPYRSAKPPTPKRRRELEIRSPANDENPPDLACTSPKPNFFNFNEDFDRTLISNPMSTLDNLEDIM
jgi:hypothetical protein